MFCYVKENLYRASIFHHESGKIAPPLLVLLRYAKLANVYVEVFIDDEIDLPELIPAREKIPVWDFQGPK